MAVVVTDFPNPKPQQIASEVPVEQIEEFPIEEAPIPQPTRISNYLIGIWQNSPSMGSGWSDHYNFYADGRFVYYISQMKCDKRINLRMGGWTMEGTNLVLTTTSEERMVGGKLVKSMGSCGTPLTLEGAKEELVQLTKPEVEVMAVERREMGPEDVHETINIGKNQFWKFDDDPTGQGEFIRQN